MIGIMSGLGLLLGLGGKAAQMGGQIAGAKKLQNAGNAADIYANRYRETFERNLAENVSERMAAAAAATSQAGRTANVRDVFVNMQPLSNNASRAATRDASAYTDHSMQGLRDSAAAAAQKGQAIGDMMGFAGGVASNIDQGIAQAKQAQAAQTYYDDARRARRVAEIDSIKRMDMLDDRRLNQRGGALQEAARQAAAQRGMSMIAPQVMENNANYGYNQGVGAFDAMMEGEGRGTQPNWDDTWGSYGYTPPGTTNPSLNMAPGVRKK